MFSLKSNILTEPLLIILQCHVFKIVEIIHEIFEALQLPLLCADAKSDLTGRDHTCKLAAVFPAPALGRNGIATTYMNHI